MTTILASARPAVSASTRAIVPHLAYRPDIDGLRALAVLAVVIFHAAPTLIPGGFVGVDVFFVISGYLISGIIQRGLAQDSFSLLDFYTRRVKRIFPALVSMLAVVLVIGCLVLLSDEYKKLGKHVMAGAGFAVNLTLFADTKAYFGQITSPLIHLWSLGVEEQFYLFWPLFLMLTWRSGRAQLALIALAALVSFGMNVGAVSSKPLAAFYLPWCRLWELAMGGLLACAQLQRGAGTAARFGRILNPNMYSSLGLALVIAAYFGLNERMAFPGWWALAPVLGATLLIGAGPQTWVNRNVLSHPVMVYVGLISYPLYLWHWPLLSFAHSMDWRQFTPLMNMIPIAVSVVLAHLTYTLLEKPVRGARRGGPVALVLCALMAVGAGVGYLAFTKQIATRALPAEVAKFTDVAKEDMPFPEEEGFFSVGKGTRQVLFIGDSTIAQYHGRFEKLLAEHPRNRHSARFAWRAGCAPDTELSLVEPAACEKLIGDAMQAAKDPNVDRVVIAFSWYAYFVRKLDNNHVGEPGPLAPATDRALARVEQMIAELRAQDKRVYLVLQPPLDSSFHPRQMVRRTLLAPGFELDIRPPSKAQVVSNFAPFVDRLRQIGLAKGAIVIDPIQALCDADRCPAVTASGEPMYRDSYHLRASYLRDHVSYLDQTVLDDAADESGT